MTPTPSTPHTIAHNLTAEGIRTLIRGTNRQLTQLADRDAQYGDEGRQVRAQARASLLNDLALYTAAHAVSVAS